MEQLLDISKMVFDLHLRQRTTTKEESTVSPSQGDKLVVDANKRVVRNNKRTNVRKDGL